MKKTHRMTEMEYINVISLLFIGTIAMARGSFLYLLLKFKSIKAHCIVVLMK